MGNKHTNLFLTLPSQGRLVSTNLEKVWEHYDVNHDGTLSEEEFKELVKDILIGMKKFIPQLCAKLTSVLDPTSGADKEWEEFLIAEVDKLLTNDGLTKLTHELYESIDLDHNGKISHQEFIAEFKKNIRARIEPIDQALFDAYSSDTEREGKSDKKSDAAGAGAESPSKEGKDDDGNASREVSRNASPSAVELSPSNSASPVDEATPVVPSDAGSSSPAADASS